MILYNKHERKPFHFGTIEHYFFATAVHYCASIIIIESNSLRVKEVGVYYVSIITSHLFFGSSSCIKMPVRGGTRNWSANILHLQRKR